MTRTSFSNWIAALLFLLFLASVAALPASGWLFERSSSLSLNWKNTSGTLEKRYLVEMMSGSGALFDFDRDGWLDIYLVSGSTRETAEKPGGPANALYRNLKDGTFEDVTAKAGVGDTGWGQGCVVADFDGDGWTDIYVTNFGPNVLYRNRGDGTFEDVSQTVGVDHPGWSTGAVFADFDGDGDLDLYVASYVEFDFANPRGDGRGCRYRGISVACGPMGLTGSYNIYYRNDKGHFTDATAAAGLKEESPFYSFQPIAFDADDDGDLDLFVANDSTPNYLYINRGDGGFDEQGLLRGVAYNEDGRAQACMGADVGDFDNDGDLDLFVTNFSHDTNTLYENLGEGFFADRTVVAEMGEASYLTLGFGTFFFDFDADGWKDLFVANGHLYPEVDQYRLDTTYRQSNQIFRNNTRGAFLDVTHNSGSGLQILKCSRGAAYGDLDNDGDLDLVVVNLDDSVDVILNEAPQQNDWVAVELWDPGSSNQAAVGARIRIKTAGHLQTHEVLSSHSYLASSDHRLYFGLGQQQDPVYLSVRWPGESWQDVGLIDKNHLYRLRRGGEPEKVF